MSHPVNDTWAEEAWSNFQQALEEGNKPLAEAIMQDAADNGFVVLTQSMATKLADYELQQSDE